MPYVKWIDAGIELGVAAHPKSGTELKLFLPEDRVIELKEAWLGLVDQPGSELRIDLPKGWTLFWKSREGDARALLAHPDAESWVGTVVLDPERGRAFALALDRLSTEGVAWETSSITGLNRLSNLAVSLELKRSGSRDAVG